MVNHLPKINEHPMRQIKMFKDYFLKEINEEIDEELDSFEKRSLAPVRIRT